MCQFEHSSSWSRLRFHADFMQIEIWHMQRPKIRCGYLITLEKNRCMSMGNGHVPLKNELTTCKTQQWYY